MVTRSEAILYAVLERCSRSPEGYHFKHTAGAIAGLVEAGILIIREDGRVVTTAKGKSLLQALETKVERDRKRELERRTRRAVKSKAGRTLH